MAAQVTNYQCPACTGPLQFDGGSGKLQCEYCGSSFPVEEIEKMDEEKEEKAAKAYEEQKDQKYSLTYVEQRAKSELGMVKLDKSGIQYVEIPNPESTVVTPGESVTSELLSSVGESLSVVVEYLN